MYCKDLDIMNRNTKIDFKPKLCQQELKNSKLQSDN